MKVAIVGGNGLVGEKLIEKLTCEGHPVTAFVEKIPEKQVEGCDYVACDLSELGSIARGLSGKNIDVLVHNAAISHPKLCMDNPYKMYHVNVEGTMNVLEACAISGIKRFVYISSAAVYGKERYSLVSEDEKLYALSPYSASKISAESMALNYGLDTVVLRLSCVYGPGRLMPEPINLLLTEAVKSGKIDWKEGIDQLYDYIYISDCVEGIYKVVTKAEHKYRVYNIAGGEEVSYDRIVKALKEEMPDKSISVGAGTLGYDNHGPLDISRMDEDFGWKPLVGVEEGVKRYLDFLRSNIRG